MILIEYALPKHITDDILASHNVDRQDYVWIFHQILRLVQISATNNDLSAINTVSLSYYVVLFNDVIINIPLWKKEKISNGI